MVNPAVAITATIARALRGTAKARAAEAAAAARIAHVRGAG
jgi:hypothetical protein